MHGKSKVSEELVVAYAASGPQVEAVRALRTQVTLRWFESDPGHKALAVVSAARNEGRSFVTANLAVVFSQLGKRTLLIDADMRNPSQHEFFGLDNRPGLPAVLSGEAGNEAIQPIPSLPDLFVLPGGSVSPNAPALLSRPQFSQMLSNLAPAFDVILIDTPSTAGQADAQTVALHAGAVLIVARKNVTRMSQVRGVADAMKQVNATAVGIVLNDF